MTWFENDDPYFDIIEISITANSIYADWYIIYKKYKSETAPILKMHKNILYIENYSSIEAAKQACNRQVFKIIRSMKLLDPTQFEWLVADQLNLTLS